MHITSYLTALQGMFGFYPIISSNLSSIQSINWLSCKIFCAQSSSKSNGVAYFLLSLRESQQELRRQPVPLSGTVPSSSRRTSSTAISRGVCLSGCQYQQSHDGINFNINRNSNVQIFYEVYSLCQHWRTSHEPRFDHSRSNPIKLPRWGMERFGN